MGYLCPMTTKTTTKTTLKMAGKISRRGVMLGAAAGTLAGAAGCTPAAPRQSIGAVNRIQVFKDQRLMQLIHDRTLVKAYRFELGFAPTGHKVYQGDGRTPEGAYRIDRRNPNSSFHLSLGISYPNWRDLRKARALGKDPGGDIFIHGTPAIWTGVPDWTWGCIAVTNAEIEEIYALVDLGTLITIYP